MKPDPVRRLLLASGAAFALARESGAQPKALDALGSGGLALLLRHAATEPGVGDPPGFRLDDCRTQRNLSDAGRGHAEQLGLWLRQRKVRIDAVLSSRWCRCLETARLAFPSHAVEPFPALDSFFDDRSAEPQRTRAALDRIGATRAPANVVLVTHQVNILALTGEAVGAGEVLVVRPDHGRLQRIGRLQV
jgi:broad specificity phosphatase PhoE